ncbi:MAG: 50S ribosomal protein L23 [Armatimonadota bacterium]|nr:50S ribosomal protein L23 [Armatimonadota bacterium]
MKDPYSVLIRPLVTEKTISGTAHSKYTFQVDLNANKIEIGHAVQQIFDVKVEKVNTLRVRGKTRRLGRFPEGRKPSWKKAIVTLKAGDRIEIFEGM